MNKIKKLFNKLGKKYTEYAKKYLATNIGVLLLTLYAIIFEIGGTTSDDLVERIFLFLIPALFLVETKYSDNKKRIPLYIISLLLAICLPLIFRPGDSVLFLVYFGIIGIAIIYAFYLIFKKQDKLEKYACKLFYNLFKVGLFTSILMIGFGMIYIIAEALILEGYDVEFYSKILWIIFGLYTIPFSIISLYNTKDDVPEVIELLIRRVLLILLDCSYVIIIIYVIKMIVSREIPRNEVFFAVTLLYLFTLPMVIMLKNYKGKFEELNAKILPWIFIAPLIVQIYSLIVRIDAYGMTSIRYVGIFLLVFEVISLFILLYKNNKYFNYNFLVLFIITIILTILPVTNLYEAPIYMQVNRLTSMWKENTNTSDFTASDRQKIKDIYEYLNTREKMERYMPKYLSMFEVNSYLMNTRHKFEGEEAKYFEYNSSEEEISVEAYKSMKFYTYDASEVKQSDFVVNIGDETVNVYDVIKIYIDNETIPEYLEFKAPSGNKLYVDYLSFYYSEKEEAFQGVTLKGYILTK